MLAGSVSWWPMLKDKLVDDTRANDGKTASSLPACLPAYIYLPNSGVALISAFSSC